MFINLPNIFGYFFIFSYICVMNIDDLRRQLDSLEERLKRVKCNRCAERIVKKALVIKKQIQCLEKKQSI